MREPLLRSVACPQCAGPLSVSDGRRLITCEHCGVRLLMREQEGYSRWYFPVNIEKLEAVGVGSGWLRKHPGITRKTRSASFVEATLLYAPIWEYKAMVAGWEFGSRLKTRTFLVQEEKRESLNIELVREKIKEPRLGERRFYQAALDLSAIGATRPRISGREFALPLLPGEIEDEALLLEPTGTATEIGKAGRKVALTPLVGHASPSTQLFPLRESVTLLYYPLWLLRYRDGNRLYEMTVDGRTGAIFSARAPAANNRRLLMTVVQMLLLALVAAVMLKVDMAALGRATPVVIAVIVSLAVLATAQRFRMEGEVEYHEPYSS